MGLRARAEDEGMQILAYVLNQRNECCGREYAVARLQIKEKRRRQQTSRIVYRSFPLFYFEVCILCVVKLVFLSSVVILTLPLRARSSPSLILSVCQAATCLLFFCSCPLAFISFQEYNFVQEALFRFSLLLSSYTSLFPTNTLTHSDVRFRKRHLSKKGDLT